jgi:integrase
VTPGKVDVFLSSRESILRARSVNHRRGYLSRAFTMARRMEKFPRANPVADVPKRKVVKRLPDHLRPSEVPPLLASLTPKWKNLFATAIYTGLRKGELFALQKQDVDFEAGLVLVGRSHDRDIPKGGRVDAIPINSELLAYLKRDRRLVVRAGLSGRGRQHAAEAHEASLPEVHLSSFSRSARSGRFASTTSATRPPRCC